MYKLVSNLRLFNNDQHGCSGRADRSPRLDNVGRPRSLVGLEFVGMYRHFLNELCAAKLCGQA